MVNVDGFVVKPMKVLSAGASVIFGVVWIISRVVIGGVCMRFCIRIFYRSSVF